VIEGQFNPRDAVLVDADTADDVSGDAAERVVALLS
jgi:hypothetical protein